MNSAVRWAWGSFSLLYAPLLERYCFMTGNVRLNHHHLLSIFIWRNVLCIFQFSSWNLVFTQTGFFNTKCYSSFYCHIPFYEYWQYFWCYIAMWNMTVFQKTGKLKVESFMYQKETKKELQICIYNIIWLFLWRWRIPEFLVEQLRPSSTYSACNAFLPTLTANGCAHPACWGSQQGQWGWVSEEPLKDF